MNSNPGTMANTRIRYRIRGNFISINAAGIPSHEINKSSHLFPETEYLRHLLQVAPQKTVTTRLEEELRMAILHIFEWKDVL